MTPIPRLAQVTKPDELGSSGTVPTASARGRTDAGRVKAVDFSDA